MIYLDSGIVMRLVEGAIQVRSPIEASLKSLSQSERVLVTSRLSRCKPLRDNRADLLLLYDGFFSSPEVRLYEIDAAIIEEATSLRATIGFKSADAIHLFDQLPFLGWAEVKNRVHVLQHRSFCATAN
jgi:hypothetical protein